MEIIKKLTEKAKPYKINNLINPVCPTCHRIFPTNKFDKIEKSENCPECSQALDWSEND